ncbi:hypothetical protein AcW2_005392 [Taiwanofungus camphoratus]|nr:hypothetical protein AcW2_005392 [Antrodia cinnamomea]
MLSSCRELKVKHSSSSLIGIDLVNDILQPFVSWFYHIVYFPQHLSTSGEPVRAELANVQLESKIVFVRTELAWIARPLGHGQGSYFRRKFGVVAVVNEPAFRTVLERRSFPGVAAEII